MNAVDMHGIENIMTTPESVLLYALLPNNSFSGKKVVKSVLQLYVSSTMCRYYPLSFQDLGQLLSIKGLRHTPPDKLP